MRRDMFEQPVGIESERLAEQTGRFPARANPPRDDIHAADADRSGEDVAVAVDDFTRSRGDDFANNALPRCQPLEFCAARQMQLNQSPAKSETQKQHGRGDDSIARQTRMDGVHRGEIQD